MLSTTSDAHVCKHFTCQRRVCAHMQMSEYMQASTFSSYALCSSTNGSSRGHQSGKFLPHTELCQAGTRHRQGSFTPPFAKTLFRSRPTKALLPMIPACVGMSTFGGHLQKQVKFRSDLPPLWVGQKELLETPLECQGIGEQPSFLLPDSCAQERVASGQFLIIVTVRLCNRSTTAVLW